MMETDLVMSESEIVWESENPGASEESEKSIYLCMNRGKEYVWYVIRSDMKTPENDDEFLPQVLVQNRPDYVLSAAAAVGSRIYVFGGGRFGILDPVRYTLFNKVESSVFSIDTCDPDSGWIKLAPMNHPRDSHYAVPINDNQICVFLGRLKYLDFEIYDLRGPEKPPLPLVGADLVPAISNFTSHAVWNGNGEQKKKILLMSRVDDRLFCYDVESRSLQVLCEKMSKLIGDRVSTITISDGILYFAAYEVPGCLMAVDVSGDHLPDFNHVKPKGILGLVGNEDYLPSPKRVRATDLYVIELAKNKLALVWGRGIFNEFQIFCTKLNICQSKLDDSTGERIFQAHSITTDIYQVKGCFVDSIVPVTCHSTNKGGKKKLGKEDKLENRNSSKKQKVQA